MKVSVIVPAAGQGKRFGGPQNKIFERLAGQPVFIKTLEQFVNREDVVQTLLVVSEADRQVIAERYAPKLGFMGVTVVAGGVERTDSVRNALAQLSDEADFVAVHDAVRPCVSAVWIDAVFAEAQRTGAAILARPIHGTIKRVVQAEAEPADEDDLARRLFGEDAPRPKPKPRRWRIEATRPREALWEAQTPQVFARALLERAYAEAAGVATDDAALVEALGEAVAVVPGDARNIKITTPEDLAFASAVLGTLPEPRRRAGGAFDEAQW